jgi:hypothetical protein
MKRLVHYVFGLAFAAGGLLALPGDGQATEGFGERVAGTYFVRIIHRGESRIIPRDHAEL